MVCWLIGLAVGAAAVHVVEEHIRQYKMRHPLPSLDTGSNDDDESARSPETRRDDRTSTPRAA